MPPNQFSIRRIPINMSYQRRRRQQQQHLLPLQHHDDNVDNNTVMINHTRQLQQQTIATVTCLLPRLIDFLVLKFEGKSLNLFDIHPLLMTISIVGLLLFSFVSYIEIPPAFTRTIRILQIAHVILGALVIAMVASIFIPQYYSLSCFFLTITYLILCLFPFFNCFVGMFKRYLCWFISGGVDVPDLRLIYSHTELPAISPTIPSKLTLASTPTTVPTAPAAPTSKLREEDSAV